MITMSLQDILLQPHFYFDILVEMSKIFECRFFNFCKESFNYEAFLKHLYSLKKKDLEKIVDNNQIIQDNYLTESLHLLKALIHGHKLSTNENYKKTCRKERKYIYSKYTATNAKSVFKKYPYLNDLTVLENIKNLVFEESVIRYICHRYGIKDKSALKFKKQTELVSYLSALNSTEKISIEHNSGVYAFCLSGKVIFLAYLEDVLKLRKAHVFATEASKKYLSGVVHTYLSISKNYKENLEEIKKENLIKKLDSL